MSKASFVHSSGLARRTLDETALKITPVLTVNRLMARRSTKKGVRIDDQQWTTLERGHEYAHPFASFKESWPPVLRHAVVAKK
jgi:hypothetical protein